LKKIIYHPYLILNFSFTGIILLIFIYSLIFSAQKDNHPVPSVYENVMHKPSPTSGLSRSFSEIVRGNFSSAIDWNKNGISLFMFFVIQLFLRVLSSYLIFFNKIQLRKLIWADSLISGVLFLVCFRNLLLFWEYF
jgi:hypothetical protein